MPVDHQGARDLQNQFLGLLRGYPQATEAGPDYPILYSMDASTIAARKNTLSQQLSAVPVVSLVATVPDFFDLAAGGLYPNSSRTDSDPPTPDPRNRNWQRLCSFEFIEADKSTFAQANACLLMTGGSSLYNEVTRKHNLRVEFDSVHGAKELLYPLFPDFSGLKFKSIHLKNPTHDSWSNTWGTGGRLNGLDYTISQVATYCNEPFVRHMHRAMGHEGPAAMGAAFHQWNLLGALSSHRAGG